MSQNLTYDTISTYLKYHISLKKNKRNELSWRTVVEAKRKFPDRKDTCEDGEWIEGTHELIRDHMLCAGCFHDCHIGATNLCDKSFLTLILVILRELEKLRSKCDRRCGRERRLPGRQWRSPCCQGVVCRLSVCTCWVFVLVLLFLCWQSNWTSFKVPVVTRIQMASSSWRGWSASALAVAMCKLLKLRRIFYPIFRNRPGVFSRVKCFVNWISKVQQEVSEETETADSAVKFPE